MNARKHTLPIGLAAVALAAPAALAALPGGAKYVGTTNSGSTVTVKLSGDAKTVKRMRIHYGLKCNGGRTGQSYTDVLGARVHKDHGFAVSATYTGSADGSKNTFHVSGKLSAGKAHGKFSLTSTTKGGGKKKLTCKTGKLTWSAKRKK
jgi:hypothetical protein